MERRRLKLRAMDAVSKATKPMADAAKDKVAEVAEGVKKNIEDKASELVKDHAKKQMKKISWKIIYRTSQRCQNIFENPAIS